MSSPRRRLLFHARWPTECDRCAQPILAGHLCTQNRIGRPIHADCDNPWGRDE